jgi:hypothetical protein
LNIAIFYDIASCGPCVNRRLGGTYYLHLQSGYPPAACRFLARLILDNFPAKRRFTYELYCPLCQEMATSISSVCRFTYELYCPLCQEMATSISSVCSRQFCQRTERNHENYRRPIELHGVAWWASSRAQTSGAACM